MNDNTNGNEFPEIREPKQIGGFPVGYIRVDKRDIKPIHKHDHEHKYAVVDSDDQNEIYVDVHCVHPGCPMGKLMRRDSLPKSAFKQS